MREYVPPPGSIPTLPVPDLAGIRSVHLVGIGGAGMSGLARVLLARAVAVSGSDLKDTRALARLRAAGATVHVGHRADQLGDPDAVVTSSAIPAGNVEVAAAAARGIPVWARAQVLAALMAGFRTAVVAGTHGKTTTTSMLAVILERAGRDPTYVVGGDLNESGSNARAGASELFVAETDESDGSFLLLHPDVAVVTNVEDDHLDFYADREEVEAAFTTFCRRPGSLVACSDDPGVGRVLKASARDALTYGAGEDSEVRILDPRTEPGGAVCRARFPQGEVTVRVGLPGRHQLWNAVGAMAAAGLVADVGPAEAAEALRGFSGVRRRYERRGTARGAQFVDDYAHHPTEIAATLAAARAESAGRLVAVFQPHRYSRTAAMWRALGESLAGADLAVLTDVYGAGETPVPGITGKLLVDALCESAPGRRTVYLPHRADVAAFLAGEIRSGDVVLTLGAGDITVVGEEIMALLAGGDGR
jgi:UDP-N-acetylmuramate--alanine ligase